MFNCFSVSESNSSIKNISLKDFDPTEKIIGIKIRSVWLGNDILAIMGSIISVTLSGNSISHQWAEIQTDKSWFCAQFNGNGELTLTKHESVDEVTINGKKAANYEFDNKNIRIIKSKNPNNKTMNDVLDVMKNFNGNYNLVLNNCQHFAKKLFYSL